MCVAGLCRHFCSYYWDGFFAEVVDEVIQGLQSPVLIGWTPVSRGHAARTGLSITLTSGASQGLRWRGQFGATSRSEETHPA